MQLMFTPCGIVNKYTLWESISESCLRRDLLENKFGDL